MGSVTASEMPQAVRIDDREAGPIQGRTWSEAIRAAAIRVTADVRQPLLARLADFFGEQRPESRSSERPERRRT